MSPDKRTALYSKQHNQKKQPYIDQSTEQTPPMLPDQWSTSYISYWQPMLNDDQITSGYCWFDYQQGVCRIDGLFNPWSEQKTGYRLWMSEIASVITGLTRKQKLAYSKHDKNNLNGYIAQPQQTCVEKCTQLLLEQDVLLKHQACHIGKQTVLNEITDVWEFQRPGKGPSTYYFKQGSNQLLRMVTGDVNIHASVRDFPQFSTAPIPDDIFEQIKT